jgi:hypothetical protein
VSQRYEPDAELAGLLEFPGNPRVGDGDAVAESIDANGFYGAVLVQESTRRILAGHTRRRELLDAGATRGPVIWCEVDDATAKRILAGDNRTAELASWDTDALLALLTEMGATDAALLGSAFTMDDMAILAAAQLADEGSRDYEPRSLGSTLIVRAPLDVIAAFHAIDRDTDLARLEYLLQLAEREQLAEGTA